MYPTARTITLSGFFLLLLLNASCAVSSGSDPALVCNSGDTRECVCSGGLSGGQVCLSDLTGWTPCDCSQSGVDGGVGEDGEDGEVGGDGEVCGDGLDNNGNGSADEGCACEAGMEQSCYLGVAAQAGVGACVMGTQRCLDPGSEFGGTWGLCTGSGLPEVESCNGQDDNCDGVIDEGCTCVAGETESCYSGPPATLNVGSCHGGQRTCGVTGEWGPCVGSVVPAIQQCVGGDEDCDGEINEGCCVPVTEICGDGIDNDCDGAIDEGCSTSDCGPLVQYQWSHEYFSQAYPVTQTSSAAGCRDVCNSYSDTVCCQWTDYNQNCYAFFGAGCVAKWNDALIGDFHWGVICN